MGEDLEQLFGRFWFRTCGRLPRIAAADEVEGDLLIMTLGVNDKKSGGSETSPSSLRIEKTMNLRLLVALLCKCPRCRLLPEVVD